VRTRAYEHTLNSSTVPAGSPALEIRDIELRFGGVVALHDVGFTVTQGTSMRSSAPTVPASRVCSTA
jgi:hypothetical protein